MKQVNLLPLVARQKAANRQIVPFVVLAVLAALLGVGGSWFLLNQEVNSLQDQITAKKAAAEAEAARLAKERKSLEVDADLLARITQVNQLSAAEVNWSKAFALVGALIPNDITLSGFTYATGQGTPTLQLKGTAASNLSFAVFVESLRGSKDLQSLKVDGFTYDPSKGSVTFTVTALIQAASVSYQKL